MQLFTGSWKGHYLGCIGTVGVYLHHQPQGRLFLYISTHSCIPHIYIYIYIYISLCMHVYIAVSVNKHLEEVGPLRLVYVQSTLYVMELALPRLFGIGSLGSSLLLMMELTWHLFCGICYSSECAVFLCLYVLIAAAWSLVVLRSVAALPPSINYLT